MLIGWHCLMSNLTGFHPAVFQQPNLADFCWKMLSSRLLVTVSSDQKRLIAGDISNSSNRE